LLDHFCGLGRESSLFVLFLRHDSQVEPKPLQHLTVLF